MTGCGVESPRNSTDFLPVADSTMRTRWWSGPHRLGLGSASCVGVFVRVGSRGQRRVDVL